MSLHPAAVDQLEAFLVEAIRRIPPSTRRTAWEMSQGMTDDGHIEPELALSDAEVARRLGVSKQTTNEARRVMSGQIWEYVARHMLVALSEAYSENDIEGGPVMGTDLDHDDVAGRMLHYGVRTEQHVHMGPGSRAFELASKRKGNDQRRALVAAHRKHAS